MKHLSKICLSLALIICCLIGIAVNAQAATAEEKGTCGDSLTWVLDSNGTLTISGTGHMDMYIYDLSPWAYNNGIKKVIVKNGVKSIGARAFMFCENITSVTISDTVQTIDEAAFSYCTNLISVRLGQSLSYIGEYAFEHCEKLKYINIPNGVAAINAYAFSGCISLKTITISDSATSIGTSAFDGCCSLESIIIPDRVVSVGEKVFRNCRSLTSVKLSSNLTNIGDYMFQACSSLKSINIPDKVKRIGTMAFKDCTSLKTATIGKKVAKIDTEAFYNCASLQSIIIPDNVTSIADYAFAYCSNLSHADIGDGVVTIGYSAFSTCSKLKSVVIGNSVKSMGFNTFENCSNLSSLKLGSSVQSIQTDAFKNCSSLKYIELPNSIRKIHPNAFWGCSGLKSVVFPDSIRYIFDNAFYGCTGLEFLVITNNVKLYNPFPKDANLKTIYFTGDAPDFNRYSFSGLTLTAYYPANNSTWTDVVKKQYDGTITWVASGPVITTQPKTCYGSNGSTVNTTVNAIGGKLKYQWYIKEAGEDKYVKSSIKTPTYSCKMASKKDGRYLRCKITDQYGNSVWTKPVRLWIRDLSISKQPVDQSVKAGTTARFTAKSNNDNVTFQWQYRTSSGSWKNVTAASGKTGNYKVSAKVKHNGYQYRCRVTDSAGNKVYSRTVTLYVFGIKTQPTDKTVVANKTAKFTVAATGNGLTYQWQYRTSSSSSWKNASATGNKTKTLSVTATAAKHGYQYRCKITNSAGNTVNTKIVRLYILSIQTQPTSKTVTAGSFTKFTVKATGTGLTYQWQYRTSSYGSWQNVIASTGKTATYGLTAQSRHNGYQYRCKITDLAENVIYSKSIKLTVE